MKRILMTSALVGVVAFAGGCSKKSEGKTAATPPAIAVEVQMTAPADLVEGVDVVGSLTPKFEAEVKSEVAGLVREVYVTEWVRVRKGQPLARIDGREQEALVKRLQATVESARANLLQTEVAATRAEREQARMQKLKDAGLATQQGLDDAGTELAASRARISAARAQLRAAQEELAQARTRLSKTLIRAPLDGVVALRDVNVGDLAGDAAAAKPLFRVVDNRLLNLTVDIPSSQMAGVKTGLPLEFTTDGVPGKTFKAKVMYVNPAVTEADRSLKVIAEIGNVPEVLKSGLFAKGRIVTGTRKSLVQVPRQALSNWDNTTRRASLFVVEGSTAKLRQVMTGAVAGDRVEIVEGLKAGDKFVTRGGFNLKDGSTVITAEAK